MLKSVVTKAMYRLRYWRVVERFGSPYYTRGEIEGTRFRSFVAISNGVIEAAWTSKHRCEGSRAKR